MGTAEPARNRQPYVGAKRRQSKRAGSPTGRIAGQYQRSVANDPSYTRMTR